MKKNHNLKWLFVIALAMSMILAACGSGGSDTKDKDSGTGKETVEGGDLIIAVLSDASSLDPTGSNDVPSSIVQANIFETLVKRDDDNNIIPGLAEKWEPIDEKTYEFTLREGVKFHDGETFTADAVKANLDRIRDKEVASPRYFLFEMISDVEVVDEYTVELLQNIHLLHFLLTFHTTVAEWSARNQLKLIMQQCQEKQKQVLSFHKTQLVRVISNLKTGVQGQKSNL